MNKKEAIIKINGEHNFFLFQDIVYYFGLTLKFEWRFPIVSKYKDKEKRSKCASEFIYDSWYDLFIEKLMTCPRTDYCRKLIDGFKDWMITTNIAITTAQVGRKEEGIPSWELDSLTKNKPSFLIEHNDDFEIYTVHFNEEIEVLFNEAIYFYHTIENSFNPNSFLALLRRYFIIEEEYLSKEISVICENFEGKKEFFMEKATYEIVEDNRQ